MFKMQRTTLICKSNQPTNGSYASLAVKTPYSFFWKK